MSFISRHLHIFAAAGLGAALWSSAADCAAAGGPFRPFLGNWRGSGQVTTTDGRREPIACRATYESGDDDTSLSQSLVCASDAFRVSVEMSATADGGSLRGQWRETTRGVQGNLSGQIDSGDFEGQVDGGGFTARISLRSNGRKQAFSMQPSAGDIRSVDLILTKSK